MRSSMQHALRRWMVWVSSSMVAVAVTAAPGQSCERTIMDLGSLAPALPSASAYARGVSADGSVVVGSSYLPDWSVRAFRWTPSGGMQELGTLRGLSSQAISVSADGAVVVGNVTGSQGIGDTWCFRWTAATGMQDIGSLAGVADPRWNNWGPVECSAISADGRVIVGMSKNHRGFKRIFRWTESSGMQDWVASETRSGATRDSDVTPWAVSADGSVLVGSNGERACRWAAGGQPQYLGTLGGVFSYAYGVSADGEVVVGQCTNAAGFPRAFRWTQAGGMQDLGALGDRCSSARAVSADGSVVVGLVSGNGGLVGSWPRSFRWTAAGGMREIPTVDGTPAMVQALAVAADGSTVVGVWDGRSRHRAFRSTGVIDRIDTLDPLNESAHATARYALNTPADNPQQRTVLRRGLKPAPGVGSADIDVVVADCFDRLQHVISFQAEHAFNGQAVVREIPFYLSEVPDGRWGCVLREPLTAVVAGRRVAKMRITIPATAAVGEYAFHAVLKTSTGVQLERKAFSRPVVLLFNPWDPADAVHLADAAERDEYVLRDAGLLWRGTARFNRASPWDFAQFDTDVLLTTLDLLNGLNEEQRTNPSVVARWLTQKLDAIDGGLLVGRWDNDYSGGTSPTAWTGSQRIFQRFRAGGPVRYGQCWVYGGLLTSSLRSLGVATRPLTNFESAHDASSPPDRIIERRATFNRDSGRWDWAGESVWNFHVWCEAWMKRSDLYACDGWQVVDATPQERSEGLFQLGPTPVSAVKEELPQPFDGAFVLSEVDADVRHTVWDGAAWVDSMPVDTTMVGRRMSTKAVGTLDRVDITDTYKTPEATMDPRSWPEVEVDAPASVAMGQPIDAAVTIRNVDALARDFTCYVLVRAVAQNGQELGVVAGPRTDPVTIPGGGMTNVAPGVTWNQLRPFLGLTEFIEFDVVVTRLHDEQRWFKQRVTVVRGLPVTIAVAPAGEVVQPGGVTVTVTCTNPLAEPLDAGTLTLTGGSALPIGGTARNEELPVPALAPGASVSFTRELSAAVLGRQMIAARWLVPGRIPGDAVTDIVVLARCPADINADGGIDGADTVDFFAAWEQAAPAGDFNADGGVDFADVEAFFDRWERGC